MKEFTKDFEFSHDGSAKTEYKAGEKCTLTGFALKCAENRGAIGDTSSEAKAEAKAEAEAKDAPKNDNKALPEGDNKAKGKKQK